MSVALSVRFMVLLSAKSVVRNCDMTMPMITSQNLWFITFKNPFISVRRQVSYPRPQFPVPHVDDSLSQSDLVMGMKYQCEVSSARGKNAGHENCDQIYLWTPAITTGKCRRVMLRHYIGSI